MRNKTYSTMSERSYHGATSRSSLYQVLPVNDILASHRQESTGFVILAVEHWMK